MKLTRRTFVASTAATAVIRHASGRRGRRQSYPFWNAAGFHEDLYVRDRGIQPGPARLFQPGQRTRRHQRLHDLCRRQRPRQRSAAGDRSLRAAQARGHGAGRSAVDAGGTGAGVARARGQDQSRHGVLRPQRRGRRLGVSLRDAAVAELLDAGRPDHRFLPPAGQRSQGQEGRAGPHRHAVRERADPDLPGSQPEARLHVRDFPVHAARQRPVRDLAAGAPRQARLGRVLGSGRRPDHRAERSDRATAFPWIACPRASGSPNPTWTSSARMPPRACSSSRLAPAGAARRSLPTSSRRLPAKGKGAGPEAKIGTTYYNYGRDDGRDHGGRRPSRLLEGAERPHHRSLAQRRLDIHYRFHRRRSAAGHDRHQGRPSGRRKGPDRAVGRNEIRSANGLVLGKSGRGVGRNPASPRKRSRRPASNHPSSPASGNAAQPQQYRGGLRPRVSRGQKHFHRRARGGPRGPPRCQRRRQEHDTEGDQRSPAARARRGDKRRHHIRGKGSPRA